MGYLHKYELMSHLKLLGAVSSHPHPLILFQDEGQIFIHKNENDTRQDKYLAISSQAVVPRDGPEMIRKETGIKVAS